MSAPTRPAHRLSGGQPGNQHGRKHGWCSRLDPAPLAAIVAAADHAAATGDLVTLRHAARALHFRRAHARGRVADALLAVLTADRLLADPHATPPAPDAASAPPRVAIGYRRPSREDGGAPRSSGGHAGGQPPVSGGAAARSPRDSYG